MKIKETNSECYYYNWGDNPNFEYVCPREYGARCEFHNKFFSAYDNTGKDLNPDCTNCQINNLEKKMDKK